MKRLKTGGREPGTPNKDKQTLLELIETKHKGYNPVISLCDIANDKDVDLKLRIYCHKEVAKYTHAPLKATESNEKNSHTTVTFVRKEDEMKVPIIQVNYSCKTCQCKECIEQRSNRDFGGN
jgi:hypothetical protein